MFSSVISMNVFWMLCLDLLSRSIQWWYTREVLCDIIPEWREDVKCNQDLKSKAHVLPIPPSPPHSHDWRLSCHSNVWGFREYIADSLVRIGEGGGGVSIDITYTPEILGFNWHHSYHYLHWILIQSYFKRVFVYISAWDHWIFKMFVAIAHNYPR